MSKNKILIERFEEVFSQGKSIEQLLINNMVSDEFDESLLTPKEILSVNKFYGWLISLDSILDKLNIKMFQIMVEKEGIDYQDPLDLPVTLKIMEEIKFDFILEKKIET